MYTDVYNYIHIIYIYIYYTLIYSQSSIVIIANFQNMFINLGSKCNL